MRLPTIQNHLHINAMQCNLVELLIAHKIENYRKLVESKSERIAHSNTSHASVIPLLEPLNCFQYDIIIT